MRCIELLMCFVIVNQLNLFGENIKEYHWLVHRPITHLLLQVYGLSHYRVNGTTLCPATY